MKIDYQSLEKKIKVNFKNKNLLIKSLTHKSFNKENNYEKLEFLGDRVLGLVISKKLLELYPDEKEGILDKKLASLVNKNKCCEIAKNLQLQNFILIENKKKITNLENKILSDCCEALIGAIYIEKGLDVVEKFILKTWHHLIKSSRVTQIDPKTRLQEYSLKKFKSLPVYKLISSTGPRHKPKFKIGVRLKDTKFVEATGNSKQKAEQAAALEYLNNFNI